MAASLEHITKPQLERLRREAHRVARLLSNEQRRQAAGERPSDGRQMELLQEHARTLRRKIEQLSIEPVGALRANRQGTGEVDSLIAPEQREPDLKYEDKRTISDYEPKDSLLRHKKLTGRANALPWQNSEDALAPSILMPGMDELSIRLVRSDRLKALEEYRSDEQRWFSIAAGVIGVALGMITQLLSGGNVSLTAAFVIVLLVLLAFGVFSGWQATEYRKRAKTERERLGD